MCCSDKVINGHGKTGYRHCGNSYYHCHCPGCVSYDRGHALIPNATVDCVNNNSYQATNAAQIKESVFSPSFTKDILTTAALMLEIKQEIRINGAPQR